MDDSIPSDGANAFASAEVLQLEADVLVLGGGPAEECEIAKASRDGLGGYLAERSWMDRVLDRTFANVNDLATASSAAIGPRSAGGPAAPRALPATTAWLPQAAVLRHETYGAPSAQDLAVDSYDAVMAVFYGAQKMDPGGPWSVHSSNRVSGPGALSGRDRLKEIVRRLGFPLR